MNTIFEKRKNAGTGEAVKTLSLKLGLSKKIAEVLAARGIDTVEKATLFLDPDGGQLCDPFDLSGMRECADRIEEAIKNREKVVVFGDYDADGVCSAAILTLFLASRGCDVVPYIPSRQNEGYGISAQAVENIIEDIIPDLVVTCDCGISAKDEIETLLDCGISVVVTDHHEPPAELPECPTVDPKIKGQAYPFDGLCGAGVALKLVHAVAGLEEALKYIDLACVATIADMVPLIDENRVITALGLKAINSGKCNLGIRTMLKKLDMPSVTAQEVSFKLAPRINAAGRMGDAYRALNLVLAESAEEAEGIFRELDRDNDTRKEICAEVRRQAEDELRRTDYINVIPIILSHSDWEKGLTSIVAAQIAGEYNRPTFLMVKSGDVYKGTARSVDGVNIYNALSHVSHLMSEFGGHAQAAGFSVHENNLEAFKTALNGYFLENYDFEKFLPRFSYDCEADYSEMTLELAKAQDALEPFGFGFPRPVYLLGSRGLTAEPMKKSAHLTLKFPGLNISAFNCAAFQNVFDTDSDFKLAVELSVSNFQNREQLSAVLRNFDFDFIGGVKNDDLLSLYYLNGFQSAYTASETDMKIMPDEEFRALLGSKFRFGTLIVAYSFKTYAENLRKYPVLCEYCHSFMSRETSGNYNRVALCPLPDFDTNGYNKVIFLDKPIVKNRPGLTFADGAEAFLLSGGGMAAYPAVSASRDAFVACFKMFLEASKSPASYKDPVSLVWAMTDDMRKRAQLMACFAVFSELGILEWDAGMRSLLVHSEIKRDLSESAVYRLMSGKE